MISNRLRSILRTAAATAVLASSFGLVSLGIAGTANADVCVEYWSDGTPFYYYC
jgi:hypothetical protein